MFHFFKRKTSKLTRTDVIQAWRTSMLKQANIDKQVLEVITVGALCADSPITMLSLTATYNDVMYASVARWN